VSIPTRGGESIDTISFDWLPQTWSYLEPLIALATLAFVFYTWYRVRKTYTEVIESGASGEKVVIDFHGDFNPSASQGQWAMGFRIVKFPLQDIELNTPEGLENDLKSKLEGFRRQHPDLFGRLQADDSNIVLTITGASSVLSLWIPLLHGISGQFPKITYPIRTGGGFVWSRPIDSQRVRLASSERFRGITEFVQPSPPEGKT